MFLPFLGFVTFDHSLVNACPGLKYTGKLSHHRALAETTEVLQEGIMEFVNSIASVVHSQVGFPAFKCKSLSRHASMAAGSNARRRS